MITLNGVTAGYSTRAPALEGFNLNLGAGQIHGLVGSNGAGKTTLLRVLAGQLKATGDIKVFGEDPFDNPRTLERTVFMGIDVPLPDAWTGRKLFDFGRARYRTWNEDRALTLAKRFKLSGDTTIKEHSRGQRSALSFIYAFAAGCELTLLDEPYLGLDVEKRHAFYETLREERGRTIVISTHHLNDVDLDTVTLLDAGLLVLSGPVDMLNEQVLAVTGTVESVGAALQRAGVPLLADAQISGARRVLLDLRQDPLAADELWEQPGVTVSGVSLDETVRVLLEAAR